MTTPKAPGCAWAPWVAVRDPKRTKHVGTRAERSTHFIQVLRPRRYLCPCFICMGSWHVQDKVHLWGTVFPSEDQSWDFASSSRWAGCTPVVGLYWQDRVGGDTWGTNCLCLSSPPCDKTPRGMLDSILIQEKTLLSDKWIWDKVLEVGALIRKEAMSYTVLVYPNQG